MPESQSEPRDRPVASRTEGEFFQRKRGGARRERNVVFLSPPLLEDRGQAQLERIDLWELYQLGMRLHVIADLSADTDYDQLFYALATTDDALRTLLGDNAPAHVELSRPAAEALQESLRSLQRRFFRDSQGKFTFPANSSDKVEYWHIRSLQDRLRTFEAVFRAEMQRAATYRVPKRGAYDTGDLVDRAGIAIPAPLHGIVGDTAVKEYQAAGRSFAFGLHTASGYHSCRAVEATLRQYFRFFTAKGDKGTEQWGTLIDGLEKVEGSKRPDPKTLGHLRHLKDFDRNPLSHLRADLDENDADVLLSGAKIAIVAMAREMVHHKTAAEPPLPLSPPESDDGEETEAA